MSTSRFSLYLPSPVAVDMLDPLLARQVSACLRLRHEKVKAITIGTVPVRGPTGVAGNDPTRILAVVTNEDHGTEEGSVFCFRRSGPVELEMVAAIPINHRFDLKVDQMSVGSLPSPIEEVQTPIEKSDISIQIEEGSQKLSFTGGDPKGLQEWLSTLRDLKEDVDEMPWLATRTTHHWLKWYHPTLAASRDTFNSTNYHRYLRDPTTKPSLSPASVSNPGNEAADSRIIEDTYVQEKMRKRLDEYSESHALRLRIGTFNVKGMSPSEHLYPFLGYNPEKPDEAQPLPDIFIFGFQELDLSTEALLYLSSTEKEDSWCEAIIEDLGDMGKQYVKVASKQLVGMLIVVFARNELRPHIHGVTSTSSGQGTMWMGNKGGVALRLHIYDTVYTFINSHLAASDEMTERRNADYSELRRLLKFNDPAVSPPRPNDYVAPEIQYSGIFESDYTFWLGDLNYRIDLLEGDVRELITDCSKDRDFSLLLPFDQLAEQRRKKRAFHEFDEGRVTFPPTYRFEIGATLGGIYDAKRRPAWTDRILYRTAGSVPLTQLNYDSHPEVYFSDHKPVTSDFEVQARDFNFERMLEILEEITVPLTGIVASGSQPSASLDNAVVELGSVTYGETVTRKVGLTNTGAVPAAWRFVRPADGMPLHPPWLNVSPESGMLLPGKTQDMEITVKVDSTSATELNSWDGSLSDILVIHVEHGNDLSITFIGQFERTCLGNDLTWLSSLTGPVRKTDAPVEINHTKVTEAPREVLRLVAWLMTHGIQEESLFLSAPDPKVRKEIIDCLDTGHEFPPLPEKPSAQIIAVGQALIDLLDSLPTSAIPPAFHESCAQALDRDWAMTVIGQLPPAAANTLISLTAFLHFMLQKADHARQRAIARIFGDILMKNDPKGNPSTWISPLAKSRFVFCLIT